MTLSPRTDRSASIGPFRTGLARALRVPGTALATLVLAAATGLPPRSAATLLPDSDMADGPYLGL